MQEETLSSNPSVTPITDAPSQLVQTLPTSGQIQTTPVLEAKQPRAILPVIRAQDLILGAAITEDSSLKLYGGRYAEENVTIARVSWPLLTEQRQSLIAFVQSKSPFWLQVIGICKETETSTWVMPALNTARCLAGFHGIGILDPSLPPVRDVAVGLYQRRAVSTNHIAWDIRHLYLDKEGRGQLLPLLSE